MPKKIKVLQDFTGGLNVDKAKGHLAENELELADNADYSERGGCQKRKDVTNYLGSYSQQVERIFEWSTSDGTEELMAILADGSLVRTSTGETIFQLIGTHISYFVLQEYLYILDGNNYYRIDDTAFNYEVVAEKDTSKEVDGAEKFKAVLNDFVELENDNITASSETVSLYSDADIIFEEGVHYDLNFTDGSIKCIKYNTDWAVSTSYSVGDIRVNNDKHYICTTAHTSTTDDKPGVGDNYQDYWDKETVMEDDKDYYIEYKYTVASDNDLTPIKKCKYAVRHDKSARVFAAGNTNDKSALYYSEYLEPDYFKGYSVIYPTSNDGTIQGLQSMGGSLLVFYPESVWVWRGLDPERDAVWEKLPIKHGTYNFRSIETTMNTVTFVDKSGIYALNRQRGIKSMTDNKVNNIIKNINNKNSIHSVFDSSNNRYMLAYSDTSGRNDKILTYDWQLDAFARWTGLGDINDFCYTKDGELLMASDNYIKKMNQPNGTNTIDFHIKSRNTHLKNPYYYKLILNLFLSLSNYTTSTQATISVDDIDKVYNISANSTRNSLREKGVHIQIDIQDNSTENLIVYDYGIEFKVVPTYRGEL